MNWSDFRQRMKAFRERHPRFTAISAALASLLAAYLAVEGVWATFSSDPLVPFAWRRVHPMVDEAAGSLGPFAARCSCDLFMCNGCSCVRRGPPVQRQPDESAKRHCDGEHAVLAGSDKFLDITVQGVAGGDIRHAHGTVRQGERVIVRKRPMAINNQSRVVKLHLRPRDTRKLRDGFMLLEVTFEQDGVTHVLDWFRVDTKGPLG